MTNQIALKNNGSSKAAHPAMRFNVYEMEDGSLEVEFDRNGDHHYDNLPTHLMGAARVAFAKASGRPVEEFSAFSTK